MGQFPAQRQVRRVPGAGHNSRQGLKPSMYAIMFEMDSTVLQASYHNTSWQNAYNDIGKTPRQHDITRQQVSVHFGDDTVDAVRCVLADQDLSRNYVRFSPAVHDIRVLRIEDNNDLMPAVAAVRP